MIVFLRSNFTERGPLAFTCANAAVLRNGTQLNFTTEREMGYSNLQFVSIQLQPP